MMLNATFNNISVISWRSVLLAEETGVPGEHHLSQVTDKRYHTILNRIHLTTNGVRTHNFSCKSNYYTITTTTVPLKFENGTIDSREISNSYDQTA
jgi:hypothetical protein